MPGKLACEFAASAHAPGAARSFAISALSDLIHGPIAPHVCDDLQLIVSELVTNSVRAGSTSVVVTVVVRDGRVAVRVFDRAHGWPQERAASIHDVGGRGLPLVRALSADWGVRQEETGKTVWAELELVQR